MKTFTVHSTLAVAAASFLLLAPGVASAQMSRAGQMGQNRMPRQTMPMHRKRQSMQAMMAEMRAMMAQMQGMMQEHGMMGGQGMMGNGGMSGKGLHGGMHGAMYGARYDDWSAMMQSMRSIGVAMQQMMSRMNSFMADRSRMANPQIRSNMKLMQERMRSMMGSMQGMIHSMEQIRKNQSELQK